MQSTEGSGGETIRVMVVDDTRIHTQLLAEVLRRDRQLDVSAPSVRSRDLVEIVKQQHIHVVVLSSNIDDEPLRGFEILRQLRATNPGIFAIMLLDSSKRETVLQAFHAGARGIFSRHDSVENLSKCIRSVHEGQIWANSEQMSFAVEALASSPVVRAVDANGLSLLSKREMDVVRSLAEGLSNREIAQRLGLSQHTIKNYLFRVYDKLGVSSRLELLFMTLTQAGAPRSAGSNAPIDSPFGHQEQRSARSGAVTRVPRSRPTGRTTEEPERRFPISAVGGEDLKLGKHSHEAGPQARSRAATSSIGTDDPLD
jgi:two-component system, NarL family, nitrate/nitrite response regulator NarL